MKPANHDPQSLPQKPNKKQERRAFTGVVLGAVSLFPSLILINLAIQQMENPGSAGDFQGGGMICLFAILAVALVGLPAVYIGITGLVASRNEKPVDKILIILYVLGIILGGPVIIALVLTFI